MAYEFAPWIRPPESLAQNYLGGLRAGADIAREQAQMQQQANLSMMEANLRQQQMQRTNALEMQRMEMEKAYQQHNLQLRNQELQQAQQLNQLKVQDAASRLAARQQYQQAVAGGMPIPEAILKFFPGTDESMTGYAQIARQLALDKRVTPPPSVETFDGEKFLKVTEPGGNVQYHPMRKEGRDVMSDRLSAMRIRELERKSDALQKALEADPAAVLEGKDVSKLSPPQQAAYARWQAKKKALATMEQQIEDLYAGGTGSRAAAGTGEAEAGTAGGSETGYDYVYDPKTKKFMKAGGEEQTPVATEPAPPAAPPGPRAGLQAGPGMGAGYAQAYWNAQPPAPAPAPPQALPPQYGPPAPPPPSQFAQFGGLTPPTAGVTTNDALDAFLARTSRFFRPGPVLPPPQGVDPNSFLGGFTNQAALPPRPDSGY